MLIVRFLRFLRGYICFSACDGFPERFLNLCNQAGVVMWDVEWSGDSMFGKTDRRGFQRMQPCAEPAGIVLEAKRKVGLPFFLYTYRRRAGMLAGLVLCISILLVLSGMVWSIEVTGNQTVPTEEILTVMEQQGVKTGVWRGSLRPKEINAAAQQALPGISWISLNLRGSSAVIEVREELPRSESEPETPQNIVASKAGQLKIIEIYAGSAGAKRNQAVPAGTLLAGGIVENADGSARLVRAQAYAVARTSIACQAAVARQEPVLQVTASKTHYTIQFLELRIPLGPAPQAEDNQIVLEDSFLWMPAGRRMPLSLERRSVLTLEESQRSKNDRQLRLAAAAAFFGQEYNTLRAAQVLRQEVEVNLGQAACNVLLRGSAYENIGQAQALE